ncbi:hypothetical protein MoryE10_13670 [Methylogaea oryzae]|uniref:Uncharacterized protein n=1 Tax=Methylogaea oryzae TaxID=1295382 RepID=A0A8D4VNB7_9GAMM|nr:hypothetical protein MoryE10_13670 [Methylogaea oryzae]
MTITSRPSDRVAAAARARESAQPLKFFQVASPPGAAAKGGDKTEIGVEGMVAAVQ